MVGSAAAVTALRRCHDVTTHVRFAGGPEPDVTLAQWQRPCASRRAAGHS
jgi:hypothetical protein